MPNQYQYNILPSSWCLQNCVVHDAIKRGIKKIESLIMIIPRRGRGEGGGVAGQQSHCLGFWSMLQPYMFGFRTPLKKVWVHSYSLFNIYPILFDHQYLTSHLSWVKIGQSVIHAVLLKVGPKLYKICFMTYLANIINPKMALKQINLR